MIIAETTEAEERFRQLAEAMPQLAWACDDHGRLTWVNRHWLDYVGSSIEESRSSNWAGVYHPDDVPHMVETWNHAVRQGLPYELEIRIRRKADQVFRWFLIRATPLFAGHGAVTGWIGTGTDIEDLKCVQAELQRTAQRMREREEQLRLALAAGHIGTWEFDLRSGECIADERTKALFGLSPNQHPSLALIMQALHPDDRPRLVRSAKDTITSRGAHSHQVEFRTIGVGDDALRWVGANGRVFFDASGAAERFIGTLIDLTAAKRQAEEDHFIAEAAGLLVDSFDLPATLRNLAKLCVARISDWCAIDLVNDEGELERVAVEHRDPNKIALAQELHEHYPPLPVSPIRQVLSTGQPYLLERITAEMIEKGARDQRHIDLIKALGIRSVALVALRARSRVIGVLSLVTAESRRSLSACDLAFAEDLGRRVGVAIDNAQLFAAEQQARAFAVEKAETLGRVNGELEQLAYVCSHDLQEPLRMITHFIELLRRAHYDGLPTNSRRFLDFISESSARMQTLIRDILTYGRIGNATPAAPEQVDLDRALDEAIANLSVAISEARAHIAREPLPRVNGSTLQFVQIFQNLLGNALKFRQPEQPAQIRISARADAGCWEISVEDRGIGIEPGHFAKIFQVFQRLHLRSEQGGNGIGLAICKKIVERAGGRIWVESQPGEGSTFRFTLPIATSAPGIV